MKNIALKGLESVINWHLKLDPDSVKRLARLEGKMIKVIIPNFKFNSFIHIAHEGILLLSQTEKTPNVTMTGTLGAYAKAARAGKSNAALFASGIEMEGDAELGEQLRDIFSDIDIDWEEHLSKIVGDTVAHKMNIGFRKIMSVGKRTADLTKDNVKEYLQHESKQLPTSKQVGTFCSDVSTLRSDVDRAAARIERLQRKKDEQAPQ